MYEDIEELAAQGYLELPDKDLHSLSRTELSTLVAKALARIEDSQGTTLADEYGRVTRLLVEDKVQLNLSKEQLEAAGKIFRQREREARRASDDLARQSLRGVNRLEVMGPLQKRAKASQVRLQAAARDFAVARQRTLRRQRMNDELAQRQNDLLNAMTSAATGVGPELMESFGASSTSGTIRTSGGFGSSAADLGEGGSGMPYTAAMDANSASPDRTYPNGSRLLRDSPARDADAIARASALRTEFMSELDDAGYIDDQNAHLADDLPVKNLQRPRLRVDGEVRVSDGHSSGDRPEYRRNDTELRLRVYPDYDIDGNWHAIGMVEAKKQFGDKHDKDDEKIRLDRYYLEGNIGLAKVDVGAFSSLMAEGNVYDSKFKGMRISAGNPVVYTMEYGKANDTDKAWNLTADYEQPTYGLGAGVYRFEGGYDRDSGRRWKAECCHGEGTPEDGGCRCRRDDPLRQGSRQAGHGLRRLGLERHGEELGAAQPQLVAQILLPAV
ncbi:hypothetical protein [Mitsuokella jalaludinii]|uniref:hypothetical protein n=1 Tax=Mitsuokella jalaludinii TaxID=187979 RepID=UPI00298D3ACC|nr:hypothetical protein [Mitsuokella jalaludinii]